MNQLSGQTNGLTRNQGDKAFKSQGGVFKFSGPMETSQNDFNPTRESIENLNQRSGRASS